MARPSGVIRMSIEVSIGCPIVEISRANDMDGGICIWKACMMHGEPVLLLAGLSAPPSDASEISEARLDGNVADDGVEPGEPSACSLRRFLDLCVTSSGLVAEQSVLRASFLAMVAFRAAALLLAAALLTSFR